MKDLRFTLDVVSGGWSRRVELDRLLLAESSTRAMAAVTNVALADTKSEVVKSVSQRFANTVKGKAEPSAKNVYSLDPAGAVFSKVAWAGVFEEGGSIIGKPLLWVPLPSTPRMLGRKRMTPELFSTSIADLWSFKSKKGTPLLGARVRMTAKRKAKGTISLSLLRRGTSAKTGVLTTIPLFMGIHKATVKRRLTVRELCQAALDRFPEFYARNFNALAGD